MDTLLVLVLLPRDATLARYVLSSCVCLSIRLSHAGIVSKRLNVESRKQRHTIVQGLVSCCQKCMRNSNGITPNGGAK